MPCPLCGGLIHPVAGKCKHCKQDLTQFRAGRPQAAATLPSLNGHAITAPTPSTLHTPGPASTNGYSPPVVPNVNGNAGTNGHVAAAPMTISQREGSQPILPPRQTGSWHAKDTDRVSMWRSWPMIVIGVAVLAIVTAVVIMVLPQDHKASGKKIGAPPPAPERMDVDPTNPKSSQLTPPPPQGDPNDPWAHADDPDDPGPQKGVLPHVQPVDPFAGQNDPNDPNDLFGNLGGGQTNPNAGSFMFAAVDKMCSKMKSCGNTDPTMQTVCDQFSAMGKQFPAPTCDAAQRCLQAIDKLSCTNDAVNVVTALYGIQDCSTALNDC